MPGGPLDALTGVRVLDLSDDVAGSYCAKLFADAGAEVVKLEPPAGHRLRRWSLSGSIGSDGDADGALFRYLAANQRSIVANLTDASGRARVLELAAASDVVIESFPGGHLRALGLGLTELQRANPALNLVSITPFGQEGPRRDDGAATSCCRRSRDRSTSTATSTAHHSRSAAVSAPGRWAPTQPPARSQPGAARSGPAGANTSTCRAWSAWSSP